MKNIISYGFILKVVFMMAFSHNLGAQSAYKIVKSTHNSMKLSGTSSLHDWDMKTGVFTGSAQFGFNSGNEDKLTALQSLTFSLPVEHLKSDKKGLDNNAYKALKSDRFANIVYKLKSATVSAEKDNKYLVKTKGSLSIAGVTKEIALDVYCVVNKDATITSTGSYKMKMSDYKIKPPSFMFGAMKTGDNITLDFTLVYEK